jgi:exonuclease SbcC
LAKQATTTRAALFDAIQASAKVRSETDTVIKIANMVAGLSPNALRLPLVAFVLRERFVNVINAANSRLVSLSDGRFQLQLDEDREGNRQSGLGLRVLDLETGRTREPASLSGGETFYTSLALALGLSDVVTERSGGTQLGTLFIDEGFGSLDPDRLEDVLEVLRKLQRTGRVIGVISHVAEMKEAIPARIEVRRADPGSTITVRA